MIPTTVGSVVDAALADDLRTPDLGGRTGTSEALQAVLRQLSN